MAKTTSLAFPNMFNISQNTVSVLEDDAAIVNRTRLLMLTDPTELYQNPEFGLGLKRHLWKYNTENEKQIIRDRLVDQLDRYEPYVVPEGTQYASGLLFTGSNNTTDADMYYNENSLEMTISMQTTYSDTIEVSFNDVVD